MKFSPCGRLLATAGQDHILRVWVLKQAFNYFLDIRTKWNADVKVLVVIIIYYTESEVPPLRGRHASTPRKDK